MTFDKYIKAYWLVITIGLICAGISGAIVHEFASRTAGIVVGLIVGGTVAAIVGGISARRRGNLRKRRRRGRRTIDCENVVRSLQPRGHVFIEDPTGRHRYRHLEVSGFYTICQRASLQPTFRPQSPRDRSPNTPGRSQRLYWRLVGLCRGSSRTQSPQSAHYGMAPKRCGDRNAFLDTDRKDRKSHHEE